MRAISTSQPPSIRACTRCTICRYRRACRPTSNTGFTSPATWSMPRTPRSDNCTTTSRTSSAAPATPACERASMNRPWRIAGWVALVLVAVLGYSTYRVVWGKPFTMNMLANRQALEFLMKNPEVFTAVGITDGSILDHHSDKLAPYTVQERDRGYAQLARFLKEVHEFDRASLDRQDQITYDILLDHYQTGLAFRRFEWLPADGSLYPISPMFGVEVQLPTFMQTTHVVSNDRTARNYVLRMQAMGGKLDSVTAEMQRQAKAGVVLPPALLERSLIVIQDTVSAKPQENA